MKNDISDIIEKHEFGTKSTRPDLDTELIFTASINELESKFPIYGIETWMDANFTKNYNWDNLAESQQKIIIEMDNIFMMIYEGKLSES